MIIKTLIKETKEILERVFSYQSYIRIEYKKTGEKVNIFFRRKENNSWYVYIYGYCEGVIELNGLYRYKPKNTENKHIKWLEKAFNNVEMLKEVDFYIKIEKNEDGNEPSHSDIMGHNVPEMW